MQTPRHCTIRLWFSRSWILASAMNSSSPALPTFGPTVLTAHRSVSCPPPYSATLPRTERPGLANVRVAMCQKQKKNSLFSAQGGWLLLAARPGALLLHWPVALLEQQLAGLRQDGWQDCGRTADWTAVGRLIGLR